MRKPLVLNFDDAAGELPGARVLALQHWQEQIRFGCTWGQFHRMAREVVPLMPDQYGCVFTGSGDYHHLSYFLLCQLPVDRPVQLIICDNHPDNMRYPFGIHCGSWVYWASRLPQVAEIHVVGISSGDIGPRHAWENHWRPLRNGKLTYWSVNQPARWTRWIGRRDAAQDFPDARSLLAALCAQLRDLPVYLSIDKDVLSPDVVSTNWDQGSFVTRDLLALIAHCRGRIVGADITGDTSLWHYRSRFKRWLSAADGQQVPTGEQISAWQQGQQALNRQLLKAIAQAWQAGPDSVQYTE